jgi:hypothetical protein
LKKIKVNNVLSEEKSILKEDTSHKGLARSIARALGTIGGGFLGGPVGAKIGGDAGEWLTKVTGFGDYKVEGNALMKEQVPSFMTSEDGITITHKEYISDVYGSTSFANVGGQASAFVPWSGLINPGNSILFPWLSTIAQSFEMFQFLGLIFEFKSTSSNALNSTNTALGTVIMTTNYDVLDGNFVTKQQAEAYEFTCSTSPSQTVIHPVECKPGRNVLDKYYVTGIESVNVLNGDPRIYYQGNFQLMTQGMQAAADIGELWVSYKVKMIRPKLPTPLNDNLPYTHIISGASPTTGLWGPPTYKSGSTLTVNMIPIAGQLYFPAPGRYYISVYTAPAGTTTLSNNWTLIGNAACPLVMTSQSGVQDSVKLEWVDQTSASTTATGYGMTIVDIFDKSNDGIALPQWISTATGQSIYFDILVQPISSGFTSRNPFGEYIKSLVDQQISQTFRRSKLVSSEGDIRFDTDSDICNYRENCSNGGQVKGNGTNTAVALSNYTIASVEEPDDNNNNDNTNNNNNYKKSQTYKPFLNIRDNPDVKISISKK